jgi:hypothetical protein
MTKDYSKEHQLLRKKLWIETISSTLNHGGSIEYAINNAKNSII